MKKLLPFLLLLLFCLTGCQNNILKGSDALLAKARQESPLPGSGESELENIGACGKGSRVLFWFRAGDRENSYGYFAMECTDRGENTYHFERTYTPLERGSNTMALPWEDGYAFLVDNPRCAAIRITCNGTTQDIPIKKDACPYLFYYEAIPNEYLFLDAEGNVLK